MLLLPGNLPGKGNNTEIEKSDFGSKAKVQLNKFT